MLSHYLNLHPALAKHPIHHIKAGVSIYLLFIKLFSQQMLVRFNYICRPNGLIALL